jgi:hypothetical protein
MSSEHLASAQNLLKGNLAGAWDILSGAQGQYTDLGIARRFGGAAAAYSLRDIGAMNGPVVRVRRDSDDTEEDFSANQVASGALETFVIDGATQKGLDQSTWQNTGAESFSSTSTDGFSYSNSSGTAFIGVTLSETLALNDSVFVSFNASGVDIPDESPQIRLRDSVSGGSASSSLIGVVNNGFNSFELEYDLSQYSSGDNIVFSEGNTGGGTVTISDFKVFGVSRNGFVETWYDQSGNGNDATQGTAGNQPAIVQNGGLLADGIDFDGVNDELRTSTNIASSQPVTVFSVTKPDAVNKRIFESITNSVRAFYGGSSQTGMNAGNTLLGTTNEVSINTEYLQTHLFNTTNSKVFLNNVETISGDAGSNAFAGNFSLGGSSAVFDGTMKEVIIYLLDKTSDRSDIENDINNHYNIF